MHRHIILYFSLSISPLFMEKLTDFLRALVYNIFFRNFLWEKKKINFLTIFLFFYISYKREIKKIHKMIYLQLPKNNCYNKKFAKWEKKKRVNYLEE